MSEIDYFSAEREEKQRERKSKKVWDRARIKAMFFGTGTFVSIYVLIVVSGEPASALLFLIAPFISSLIVAATVSRREHIISTCFQSFFVNLLASFILLGEGFFCAVMAAPIFAIMTWFGAWIGLKARPKTSHMWNVMIAALLAFSAYDAAVLAKGAPVRTVTSTFRFAAPVEKIWRGTSFSREPSACVPLWLRLWVPRAEKLDFSGEGVGARRVVDFGAPQPGDDGDTPRGKIVFEITEWTPNEACAFVCRENETKLGQWLELGETRMTLSADASGETVVTFTSAYRRKLGPAFYFVPFMDAALGDVHGMLFEEMKAELP